MRTILVVDDLPEMRRKFRKLLRAEGFTVFEAPDAVGVANILMREKSNLELILLDINVGEVDGRDIFDIVDEYAPGLQIIVSSVFPLSEQKLKIPRANDYYDKSDSEEVLLAKIHKLLGVETTDA